MGPIMPATPRPAGARHPPRTGHSPRPGAQRGITGCAAEEAQVTDNDDGIVVDYAVQTGNPPDAPQLAPAISRIRQRAGRAPRSVTADLSYGEPATDRELEALGVRTIAIPRKAKVSPARRDIERARGFRRLVKWRTGSEGRISCLKRQYGWERARLDGRHGAAIWCGHGIFAHNLVKISTLAS
jgi:transposase, IS5 family